MRIRARRTQRLVPIEPSVAAIVVSASASDNVGVTQVQFYLNGVLQSTDTTSPYSWSWNTTSVGNGSHTLQSRASDAAGNVGTSSNVTVTVNNVSNPVTVFSDGAESATTTFGCSRRPATPRSSA